MDWITLKADKFDKKKFQRIRNQVSDQKNSLPIFSQILKKYENICDTIAYDYIYDDDINASIVWDCDDKNNKRKIIYPGGYKKFIAKIKKCEKDFIIIPLHFSYNFSCVRLRAIKTLHETRLKMLFSVNQKLSNLKKQNFFKDIELIVMLKMHIDEKYWQKIKKEIKPLLNILINITKDFLNMLEDLKKSADTRIRITNFAAFFMEIWKEFHVFLTQLYEETNFEKLAYFFWDKSDVLNWDKFANLEKYMNKIIHSKIDSNAAGHFNIII